VSNIGQYVKLDKFQTSVEEKEMLSPGQRYNEYVMTSLRTVWGCDTAHILNVFGRDFESYFKLHANSFIVKGHLLCDGSKYFLTDEGKLFADGIASELFYQPRR
jgi:oxygen-independent coproporphyrinogen-3 oxidase